MAALHRNTTAATGVRMGGGGGERGSNCSDSNKVPVVQPSHAVHPLTPLITYSDEHFAPGPHSGPHPQDMNKQGRDHETDLNPMQLS
ncbi:hypothetical protein KUCAC02_015540 [Chaenocephalus aceratus]|uniref:Uncharacterized protein n=1 Tax=Chaenocephalus aceratus TaxID=36190 RepID=A0ACB9XXT5_CHAAC|nr:hypothetical protein KUCAC02_015540 [Chaenocephalus aceratus]